MKTLRSLFILQLLTIPLVVLIFKLPFQKQWSSLIANGVFWGIGLLTLTHRAPQALLVFLAGLQFLVFAVVPISILRVFSWNQDFNSETLLGFTGREWHSFSNSSFLLMLALTAFAFGWNRWKQVQS